MNKTGLGMNVPYFQVPNAIFDDFEFLGLYEKVVYMYLCRCSNNGGAAFPSYQTIAKKCGMSKRKAIESVSRLQEAGLLKKEVRKSEDTMNNYTNIYHVRHIFGGEPMETYGYQESPPSESKSPPSYFDAPPSDLHAPNKELSYKEPINKNQDTKGTDMTPSKTTEQITTKITTLYKEHCPNLPAPIKITDKRRKAINARLKEHAIEDFETVFKTLGNSKFHNGENDRDWKANLDWVLKPDNFIKILERSQQQEKEFQNDFTY